VQAHAQGKEYEGIDVDNLCIGDMKVKNVYDTRLLKEWVLKFVF
jgi:hypothetical protein